MENIEENQPLANNEESIPDNLSDREHSTNEIDQLRSELEEALRERSQFRDLAQRVQADFINFRRRSEEEQQQSQLVANSQLLSALLPVIDDFDRAQDTIPRSKSKKEVAWLDGLELVIKKLRAILEGSGVQIIEVGDEQLNPNLHEAVAFEEKNDLPEGKILNVIRHGYTLHGKLLRPTLVTVAKSPKFIEAEISPGTINEEEIYFGSDTTCTRPIIQEKEEA